MTQTRVSVGTMRSSEEDTMAKRIPKKTPEERAIASIKAVLRNLDKVERQLGRTEDRLGLPRSRADELWDHRLRRIREANARCREHS